MSYFHGREVRDGLKTHQRRIGYVPEEPHLYPHLSGREYLQLAGRLPRRTLEPKMDKLIRLFELWEDRHSPLVSYSKGMRQKILISAAYSGLDVNTAMVAHDSVARLRERMEESSLEGVFAQLTQPENTDAVARQILDVVAE